MRSDKQIEASRRNGTLSHGPITLEGKSITSRNAITHGLQARDILLRHESPQQFEQLLNSNLARFAPQDDTEMRIERTGPGSAAPNQTATSAPAALREVRRARVRQIGEYSVAEWRLRRAWTLIAALIDNRMDSMAADVDQAYEQLDHATRAALAHDHSTKTTMSLRELENHVSRYSRATDRAIRRLQDLRKLAPPAAALQFPENEPKEA